MKICVINLGCKVNQYEVDAIISSLEGQHQVADALCPADLYIVNTCAVTGIAERKSRQYIAKILKLNPEAKIIVCGCASEADAKQFENKPNVVTILGTAKKGEIKNILTQKLGNIVEEIPTEYEEELSFIRHTPRQLRCHPSTLEGNFGRTRAYLKIQDGCDNFCSYCLIPKIRGRSRSRSLKNIAAEAEILSKTAKEIVLTGINMSDYKIGSQLALTELITALKGVNCRLRLSSLENNIVDEPLLTALKGFKNFCPHFHLSLQSGSNQVLKDMNRRYTRTQFLEKVALIRKCFDQPAITTDIIVGYPAETEQDFCDTLDLVKKAEFSDVHFFAYSKREGTPAGKLKQINGSIIKDRETRLSKLTEELKIKYNSKFVGKKLSVLFEENADGCNVGYSANYIRCYFKSNKDLSNQILEVTGRQIFKDGLLCDA